MLQDNAVGLCCEKWSASAPASETQWPLLEVIGVTRNDDIGSVISVRSIGIATTRHSLMDAHDIFCLLYFFF